MLSSMDWDMFLLLVAVFALSMGGFSRAKNLDVDKKEIWLGAFKLAIGCSVIGILWTLTFSGA
jgi:hypothetical protein